MRTLAKVQKAARAAQVLIDILVDIGGKNGPTGKHAVEDATRWFGEMNGSKASTLSIEAGLLCLCRDADDMGFFTLYVQVPGE
jgi:hypothetical protein